MSASCVRACVAGSTFGCVEAQAQEPAVDVVAQLFGGLAGGLAGRPLELAQGLERGDGPGDVFLLEQEVDVLVLDLEGLGERDQHLGPRGGEAAGLGQADQHEQGAEQEAGEQRQARGLVR
jgi:hypothetical protein